MTGQRGHIGALDGFRGIAVVFVVLFHYWIEFLPGGFIGVNLFFVLSGYLITSGILATSTGDTEKWFGAFWIRRIGRLLPAAFLTLSVVYCAWTLFGWIDHGTRVEILMSFTQVHNWRRVLAPETIGIYPTPVAHFWSLSMEVQLYALTTLFCLLTKRRILFLGVVSMVWVVTVLCVQTFGSLATEVSASSTLTRGAEFACGIFVATVLHDRTFRLPRIISLFIQNGVLVVLVLIAVASHYDPSFYDLPRSLLVAILAAVVVLISVNLDGSNPRWLSRGILPYLGRISYGVYLFHWPLYIAANRIGATGWLRPTSALIGVAVLAPVSYKYFERPLIRFSQSRAAIHTRS